MKKSSWLSLIAAVSICSSLMGFSPSSNAAAATNLVTICLSATTTTQASKCTKWQYNVYSPTAYIETYPQVSPGPKVWTDPAYQYILGSTITPAMGVKVCPTALTPGISFTSASADPCPSNVLISASTVLPPSTYAVTLSSAGIVVYQVNASGVSQVSGSPFTGAAGGNYEPPDGPPYLIALDPSGQYLYSAIVFSLTGGTSIVSYKMVNGVPQPLSVGPDATAGRPTHSYGQIIATTQHVYASYFPEAYPEITILSTTNGVLSATNQIAIQVPTNLPTTSPAGYDGTISFAVDPQEKFLYWYLSSNGGPVADTVAIYSLNFANSTATLVSAVPMSGPLLVGAQ